MSVGLDQLDWIEPAINFGAVILGAALGWGTSYFFESKRLKAEQKGTAYSLIFKMLFYADEIWKINQQIAESIKRASDEGHKGPLWSKLNDIVGFKSDPERFSAEELSLVADTRDVALLMKILEVESGHSILMQAIQKIRELRSKLEDLNLAQKVEGRTVSFGGPAEDYPKYAHIFINLNDLSEGLDEQSARIAANANEVAGSLGQHLKQHYKFKPFVTFAMASNPTPPNDADGPNRT